MSFSYTPPPSSDLHWVRLLIGDTVEASVIYQDEEIQAFIDEQEVANSKAVKYAAAADALSALEARWAGAGQGVRTKTVSRLSKTWGMDDAAGNAIERRIEWLRGQAARLSMTSTSIFRTAGRSRRRQVI